MFLPISAKPTAWFLCLQAQHSIPSAFKAEVRLREDPLSPSLVNSRYCTALKQPLSDLCPDSGSELVQLKLMDLCLCGTGCKIACSCEDFLLKDSNCPSFAQTQREGKGKIFNICSTSSICFIYWI